jgi:hypothetical protein
MPIPNRISAELSQEATTAIKSAITTIGGQLPFLIDLKQDEREQLHHVKTGNKQFVDNALLLVNKDTGFLPRDFNADEFKKDGALFNGLLGIHKDVAGLLQRIDDTMAIAGSEAYAAALAVYNYAKSKNVATPGLDPYVDDLTQRFTRKTKAKGDATQQNPPK